MASHADLVAWLRAAGEPTRLRLLALCSQRDFSVTDLAEAVGQSEPRVSRHLKILCEAGLLTRLRRGQWVHYGVARDAAVGAFVQGLLGQLDRADPVLTRDRERIRAAAVESDGRAAAEGSRLGRALRAFIESGRPQARLRAALLVGVRHPELLECAAALAHECTALAFSRRSAQAARAWAEERGLRCRVQLASAAGRQSAAAPAADGRFDALVLDHLAAPRDGLESFLESVRPAAAPGAHVWLFERYEALEERPERVVEHPLARLRRVLAAAGLECLRINPIEADGEHVLAAAATARDAAASVA